MKSSAVIIWTPSWKHMFLYDKCTKYNSYRVSCKFRQKFPDATVRNRTTITNKRKGFEQQVTLQMTREYTKDMFQPRKTE
jgi:hypothetical protein